MSKKSRNYPRSKVVARENSLNEPAYISWAGKDATEQQKAFTQMSKSVDEYIGISRTSGSFYGYDYSNLAPNVSGRPGLTRDGYEAFRPNERIPSKHTDICAAADAAYQNNGLIRNVIDLMSDFACQGIRLVHPNKRIEKFYRQWWNRVNGTDRSERFLNLLYRQGNVVIRRQTAKIKTNSEQTIYKAIAAPDTTVKREKVPAKEIPWRYNFLDPCMVTAIGGPLASFVGEPVLGVRISEEVRRIINNPKSDAERNLVANLPDEIRKAAKTRSPVLLPPDKTSVFYYKKDDWRAWANPMIHSIMKELFLLEKLKLADIAALDGAISNIRILKLGSLEHQIAPSKALMARLGEILETHTGVGTMDLVWGPDIELIESTTQVHQFLGEEKYKPTLNAIYAGLGIPPTLTGTFGAAGTTNNFISLKTLTQRLEYGRMVLNMFWDQEIIQVQKAMGFRFPARVEFEMTNLADEEQQKALLIQLADRSLISDELLQQYWGHDPEMERIRINREQRERDSGATVAKAGAFHDPQFGIALKKVALQTGSITMGQTGVYEDAPSSHMKAFKKQPGEKTALEMRPKPAAGVGAKGKKKSKKAGVSGQGRPKTSKDSKKRKTKKFTPKSKAMLEVWGRAAQAAIAVVLNDGILSQFGKKNMRSLSHQQLSDAENIKFGVLSHVEPFGVLDENTIVEALQKGKTDSIFELTYNDWAAGIQKTLGRSLTMDEIRQIQVCVFAAIHGEDDGDN